jgi:bifunctional pyridoxal-dependent enzyme with beta-cystathionase and maltose regulon repressor activities
MEMYNEDIFNSAGIEGMLAAPGEKWHRDPPDVIPMWLADPDFPTAPFIKKALINAVQDEDLFYGSDAPVREKIAEKIRRVNKLNVTVDNVMVTLGVIPAMWLAVKHACKEGDEIVVTDPMYFPFFTAVNVTNTKPIYWKLHMDEGYRFDIERLKEQITKRTKLIFVCNPHNPCGRVMSKEELKGIADVAVDHKITVMVDELWEDIVFDDYKHITLASLNPEIADLTMTSWGFSKTWGIAGLRIGYLAATNMKMMDNLRKLGQGIMRGSSTLSYAAAMPTLDPHSDYWKRDMMKHLHHVRGVCYKRFEEMGSVTVPELQGTYLVFPKFDVDMTADDLYKLMFEKAKVSLGKGTEFGPEGEKHLRMTIATSEQILNEAMDRIEKALKTLK